MNRRWKGVLAAAVALAALPAGTALAQAPEDTTPPAITVVAPEEGATYTQGQVVTASYTCADDGTVADCSGPAASGAALDTSALGSFTFTVTARDAAGNSASVTRGYTVVPVAAPVDGGAAPSLAAALAPTATFDPFIPGLARDYTASLTLTVTSTAANATLWVADPDPAATGRLANGPYVLSQPLTVSAAAEHGTSGPAGPVGGSANPNTLITWDGPLASEAAVVTFKQTIAETEPLRTGTYHKTLTFTLSTTEP